MLFNVTNVFNHNEQMEKLNNSHNMLFNVTNVFNHNEQMEKLVTPMGLDSSAAAAETKSKCKFSRNHQKF